ncbi:hypothetical protein P280DRAFT_408261 [Massarina eburnea CBS 473.64]|uniref:Nephrocystin 3-like N-terminal domain-containing protein n=1 Tax=Massarina eburnea CBS 473.64 TaxID=1395130 RepID=A0A6A6RPC4_9PLEO|nr:hypothetical protein P280DRAFT_408261 [Massarina eburnea CBS 473.64]
MSDPLSVTASIIAVLSLTAKVNDYLINVKISSEEHSRCANEAGHLYSLLSSLRFRVEGATASEPWFVSARALAVENGPLDQFKMDLELLQRTLTDGGKIRKALMWKFDKEEIDRVLGRMERLKALIGMSLETDHFKLSQAIKEEMSNLKDNTGLIKGDTGLIKGDTGLIKDDTGSIRTYLPVLDSIQKDQQANQEREKLDELLTWLSTTEFPAQLEDILMRRHEGTCQWLLEAPEFQKWLVESKQTLFCPGIPGAGKTVAAAIAIDHCLKREALAKDGSIGVAYMFCNYNAQNEQQTVDLLAAILKQLTCSKPSVAEHAKTLRKKSSTVSHRKASTGDILDTLSAILQSYTTVYVVVDALDECSDAVRSTLPAKLQALQSKHDFRILITSRFNSDILDTFNDALSLEVRANTEDVKLCIASQIEKLPRCIQRDPELALLVSEKIAKATDGM